MSTSAFSAPRGRLLAAAVLLFTIACGSTAPVQQADPAATGPAAGTSDGNGLALDASGQLSAPSDAGDPGADDPGTADLAVPGSAGTTGSSASGRSQQAAGGGSAGGGGSTGPQDGGGGAGSPGGRGAQVGPGVTADKLHVGLFFVSDGDEANEATGFESTSADARDVYNALLRDVNRRGGVLGRKLVPVYYRGSAVTSQTVAEQAQAACSHWHEDNKVFAVIGFPHPVALECTRKVGGVHVYAGLGTFSPETFARYPELVEVAGMNVDRQATVTIDGLAAQGYFKSGATPAAPTKVGILTFDTPAFRRAVKRSAAPALARHGIRDPEIQYIQPPQRAQEVGNSSSEIQSAVLRFKAAGVTHVVILEGASGIAGGGHLMFLFTNSAEPQAYRPRYGLNSGVGLNGVSPQTPEGQLDGARAVGWLDPYDMPESKRQQNSAVARCRRIMKRAGLPSSGFAFADSQIKCDQVFFFAAAMQRAGAPNRQAFIRGVDSIGTGYVSAVALATRFAPNHHDGVTAVRNAEYVPECRCFHPTSKPYRP